MALLVSGIRHTQHNVMIGVMTESAKGASAIYRLTVVYWRLSRNFVTSCRARSPACAVADGVGPQGRAGQGGFRVLGFY
eukprot:284437-Prorocentrum_minimum.AAC.3